MNYVVIVIMHVCDPGCMCVQNAITSIAYDAGDCKHYYAFQSAAILTSKEVT